MRWLLAQWPMAQGMPVLQHSCGGLQFLSKAQLQFTKHYCAVLLGALENVDNGEVTIDMDEVADAVVKSASDRPTFYIAEESQQCKFRCRACNEYNDILGRFGYCSLCGTRNDLIEFEDKIVRAIRERLNTGAPPHDGVRDAVAAFDTFVAQYAKQLAEQVPMTARRIERLTKYSFHDLDDVRTVLKDWFDIELCTDMKGNEIADVKLMFYRRHIYEHNGGEVDQKYLDKSGDTTVRLKQVIRETQEGVHALLGSLVKMARNLHAGFHELIEVEEGPIRAYTAEKRRLAERRPHG